MASEKKPRRMRKQYLELLQYSGVGLEMGFAVMIGVGIGWYLDNKVFEGTRPWLTMAFLGLGLVAGGRAFLRAAREMRAKALGKEEPPRSN